MKVLPLHPSTVTSFSSECDDVTSAVKEPTPSGNVEMSLEYEIVLLGNWMVSENLDSENAEQDLSLWCLGFQVEAPQVPALHSLSVSLFSPSDVVPLIFTYSGISSICAELK